MRTKTVRLVGAATSAVFVLVAVASGAPPATAAPHAQTVVSLTFDDGTSNQRLAATALAAVGMHGTFHVSSGLIDTAGYLSRADLAQIAAAGHEIGGHTVGHSDLGVLPPDELKRQVCNDRATLLEWGFEVTSFAYPFAVSTPEAESIVKECGYNSGRMLGDLRSPFECQPCVVTERIPPVNSHHTKAYPMFENSWTLDDLKASVTGAENATAGGESGWLQLTFHDVCIVDCSAIAITLDTLREFLAWLDPRAGANNTVVKTVAGVIGGSLSPAVTEPLPSPARAGVNGVVNPSLESTGGSFPYCWGPAGFGDHNARFSSAPGRLSPTASTVTVTDYEAGDAKLLTQHDLGQCSPTVTPGHRYSARAWYHSTVPTQFTVYLRNAEGMWSYWSSSTWYPASADWTLASWILPSIPDGTTGLSFGLNIFSDGQLTTDDYALYDMSPGPGQERFIPGVEHAGTGLR